MTDWLSLAILSLYGTEAFALVAVVVLLAVDLSHDLQRIRHWRRHRPVKMIGKAAIERMEK